MPSTKTQKFCYCKDNPVLWEMHYQESTHTSLVSCGPIRNFTKENLLYRYGANSVLLLPRIHYAAGGGKNLGSGAIRGLTLLILRPVKPRPRRSFFFLKPRNKVRQASRVCKIPDEWVRITRDVDSSTSDTCN